MNMRRTIPIVLAPLLLVAACGGDDEASSDTDAPAGSSPQTTTADAATTVDGAATTVDGAATTAGDSDTTMGETATTGGDSDTTMGDTATTTDDTGTTAGGEATAPPAGDGGSITVGSANFSESQLLAQIYGQALAEAGFEVDYELGIGAREVYYGAIESGEVDLLPEYTNSLLGFVLRLEDPEAVPDATDVEEQVAALDEALPDSLTVLTPSTAEDKDVIVCTSDVAEEYGLTNLTELAAVFDQITLGAPAEFETRSPFGLVGFSDLLDAPDVGEFVPLDPGVIIDALTAGQIDCGNVFSTNPLIETEGLVSLEDDQTLVPNEAILPLVRSEVVTDQLSTALDAVNAELTTDVLKELLVEVDVNAAAPDVVAEEWLASLG